MAQIKNLPDEFVPCQKILFTADSQRMLLYQVTGVVTVLEFKNDVVDLKQTIELNKFIKDVVHLMVVDDTGKYLACSDVECNIGIWMTNKNSIFKHYINLPKYKHPPTSIAFRPDTSTIVAVFPDRKCFEYDLDDLKFVFSTRLQFPDTVKPSIVINQLVFDPRNPDILVVGADKFMGVVDKQAIGSVVIPTKKRSNEKKDTDEIQDQDLCPVKLIRSFPHLIHLSWLAADNDIVAVTVNPFAIIEQLPPIFKKKRYGKA